MNRQLATLFGISALLLWATLVGLLRLSTTKFVRFIRQLMFIRSVP